MSRQKIVESWEFDTLDYQSANTTDVVLVESNGKQIREGVLGIVKGASFFGDSFSRNGRFYPKELWFKALSDPEWKRNFERGLVFSCIGHPENYTLDELLESGRVAAKVADVQYDGKVGIVTYEILDTPAGRILNTIFRAGSKPYVSTRAFGSFSNEKKEYKGKKVPVLNVNDFQLESIDFVLNPGFLETDPNLVESIQSAEKSGIICENGICRLCEDEKDVKNVSEDSMDLEKLDKYQLIALVENLKLENEYLLNESNGNIGLEMAENPDNKDFIKNFKHFKQFISYMELLLKALKFNIEFESEYEALSGILDTRNLSNEVLSKIQDVISKIKEKEFLDESIEDIIAYIEKIIEINSSKDSTKDDSDIDEGLKNVISAYISERKLKETLKEMAETNHKLLQEKEQEIKTLKMALENLTENFAKVQESSKQEITKLNKVIENMKLANENASYLAQEIKELQESKKQLQEELKQYKEKNKTLKEKLKESKKPIIENNTQELNEVKKEAIKLKEALNEKEARIEQLSEELQEAKSEIEVFETSFETLNEKVTELLETKKQLNSIEEKYEQVTEELQKIKKESAKTQSELNKYKIAYLQEKYRVEKSIIENLLETLPLKQVEEKLKEIRKSTLNSMKNESIGFEIKETKKSRKTTLAEKLL